ncbi:MAG TPA: group 1 truncated hemoglobin [Aquabacterium sp.]|nr:group 1 truncated hemoglobin [Aquabacterium sp.]
MIRIPAALTPERMQHIKWALMGLTISWTLAALLACSTTSPGSNGTLFQQLGGTHGIDQVIGRTLDRVAGDPRSKRSFQGIKMPYLKKSVSAYVCQLADGPCQYDGENMANAHAQTHITASEFDVMVTVLREELNRAGVSEGAKNELLRRLAPTRRDIVKAS